MDELIVIKRAISTEFSREYLRVSDIASESVEEKWSGEIYNAKTYDSESSAKIVIKGLVKKHPETIFQTEKIYVSKKP